MTKHKHKHHRTSNTDNTFQFEIINSMIADSQSSDQAILERLTNYLDHLEQASRQRCSATLNQALHQFAEMNPNRKATHEHLVLAAVIEFMVKRGYDLDKDTNKILKYKHIRQEIHKHFQSIKRIEQELVDILRHNLKHTPRAQRINTVALNNAYQLCRTKPLGCLTAEYEATLAILADDLQQALDKQKDHSSDSCKRNISLLLNRIQNEHVKSLDDTQRSFPLFHRASG